MREEGIRNPGVAHCIQDREDDSRRLTLRQTPAGKQRSLVFRRAPVVRQSQSSQYLNHQSEGRPAGLVKRTGTLSNPKERAVSPTIFVALQDPDLVKTLVSRQSNPSQSILRIKP